MSTFRSFLRGLFAVHERGVAYSDRFGDAMNLHNLLQDN